MWRRALLLGLLTMLVVAAATSAAGSPIKFDDSADEFKVIPVSRPGNEPTWAAGEILVRLKSFASTSDVGAQAATDGFRSLNAVMGAEVAEAISVSDGAEVYRIRIPATMSVEEAITRYESRSFVEYAEPNYLWYPDATIPNDRFFSYLYNMHNVGLKSATSRWAHVPLTDADIDAAEAWDIRTDASDVIVCVIDQGIQYYHPDLADNMWVNPGEIPDNGIDDDGNGYVDDVFGWDFFHDDATVYHEDDSDYDTHGTHVAGTIGARGNNADPDGFTGGVAGVAWNVKLMSCKFLGNGGGSTSDAIKALNYAKMMGATITSNSWGGGGYSRALEEAIANSGMLFIAAAGNSATDNDMIPHYPSSYDLPNVIAVAATEWNDKLANFSCFGSTSVDIAAPGHMILSCLPDGAGSSFAWMGGTSMATPHVSGAAALLIAEYPHIPQYPGAKGWKPGQETIRDILLKSGDPLPDLLGRTTTGRRLNVANALTRTYPPGIEYATADVTFGAPPLAVRFEAGLENPGDVARCWWEFGAEDTVYGLVANKILADEGSIVAWFYAEGIDGSIAKMPVQVTAANPGTMVYVDDTGAFDVGTPLSDLFTWAADDAEIPYVTVNTRYPLGLSETAIENPIFWDAGYTRFEVVSPFDQEFLAAFMDNGGKLFMAAPNYLGDMGLDWFGSDYLHMLGAYALNLGIQSYLGIDGDPITDGIQLASQVATNYDDLIAPDYISQPILTGMRGGNMLPGALGLRHANTTYRVVYLSAPWCSFRYAWDGYDPENPDVTTSPYLLTKIYQYLTGDINIPPVIDKAEASLYFAKPGQPIAFAGAGHDPDPIEGGEVSFFWNFDDGSFAGTANAAHAYTDPGLYWPTLWVEDAEGEYVGAELMIIVLDPEGIVYVDDDEGEPDVEDYWASMLDNLNKQYVIVEPDDVLMAGGAKAGLEQFRVIWNCSQFGSLNWREQDGVADFLDKGGRLFLNGPEVMWVLDPETSEFSRNYLHVIGKVDDVGTTKVRGVAGHPLSDGMDITLDFGDFVDGTDSLVLGEGARAMFLNDSGMPCALTYEDGHRLAFFAFMAEAIPADAPTATGKGGSGGSKPVALTPAEILLGIITDWLGLPPEVQVLAPEAGDEWHGINRVEWIASHIEGMDLTITLQYSLDAGATWTTFATGLPNGEPPEGESFTGSYNWDVSSVPKSGPCRIKVIASDMYGTTGEEVSAEFLLVNVGVNALIAGPNPARSEMNFWVNASGGATLYIYDIAGRLVFSKVFAEGESHYVWPLVDGGGRPLANGLYLCYMITADDVKTDVMRLVINR